MVDGEFQMLIDDLRHRGFHAEFRRWGMGDTIFVGHDRDTDADDILAFRRALYVGQRANGRGWILADGMELGDEFSTVEIGLYIEWKLSGSASE